VEIAENRLEIRHLGSIYPQNRGGRLMRKARECLRRLPVAFQPGVCQSVAPNHNIALKSAVLDKLLDRLDQIEPGELQGLLSKLVREKGLLQKVFEALREGVLLLDSEGQD
jgi:hypothetical protein